LQKSILLVEDELDLAKFFRIRLERHGYFITCFIDPKEALENFKLDVSFYSLILTDLRMPDINGIEFAKQIRKMRKDIYIWLMTAYYLDEDLNKKENCHLFDKIFVKPVPMANLISNIDEQFLQKNEVI